MGANLQQRLPGSVGSPHLRILGVGAQTTADNRRTNALLVDEIVVVASVVDFGDLAVDDADDGVAGGTAAGSLEAPANERQVELHATDILVFSS